MGLDEPFTKKNAYGMSLVERFFYQLLNIARRTIARRRRRIRFLAYNNDPEIVETFANTFNLKRKFYSVV